MKKILLSLSLLTVFVMSISSIATAADITFTKPTIKVNTTQEQNAIQKAKDDAAKAKAEAKAKQEAREKAAKEKQAQREKAANDVKQNAKQTAESFKNLLK